jgi:pimeloyl-ACP methyl ester carboxylesterase
MTILGHSIGNAIWWQWIKNFGTKYIEKFILIDEIACLTKNPQNSIKTNLDLGSIVSQNQLYESYNILIKGNNESKIYRENLINNHFSNKFKIENPEIMYEIFKKVNLYGFNSTSNILFSNLTQNWINLLLNNKINIPTYLFGGINSNVLYQSIIYQKQYYKNSQIYIFEGETSSHFAFMENYKLFNKLLKKFL